MPNSQVYFKVKPGILVMMENVQNNKWNNFFKANIIDIFLNFKSKNLFSLKIASHENQINL